jgi:hypothetical protein
VRAYFSVVLVRLLVFCFVLFCFVLFCFVLFCFVLFLKIVLTENELDFMFSLKCFRFVYNLL